MQTADCRLFDWIMLPFLSLTANHKQATLSDIQANQSDIQSNQSDAQVNKSSEVITSITLIHHAYS